MSNLKKIVLIWWGIFIVSSMIGSILFLSSSGFIEYNRGNLDKIGIKDSKSFEIINLANVEVISISTDVELINTNLSEIKFELTGTYINNSSFELPYLELEEFENGLRVKIHYPKKRLVLGLGQNNLKLKIFIPEDYNESFLVKTASGDVRGDFLNFNNFEVSTVSGDIFLEEVNSKISKAKSTSGDINLKNSFFDFIETVSGDIEIENILIKKDVEIKTISGNVELCGISGFFETRFESVSGDFNERNFMGHFDEGLKVFVKTVSGDLDFNENC